MVGGFSFLSMMTALLVQSPQTKAGYKDDWKGASLILNQADAKNIFTEKNIFLNYYLEYHGEKYAGDYDDFLKSEASDLWLLRTPYDTNNMLEQADFQIIQEHHLSHRFFLYQVTRK